MAKKKPAPVVDEPEINESDEIVTSASAMAAAVKGPARHDRTVPPERRHGVRAVPPALEEAPSETSKGKAAFPKALYDKHNNLRTVKDDKALDAALKTKKWFKDPQGDYSAHRHTPGAVAPHLE